MKEDKLIPFLILFASIFTMTVGIGVVLVGNWLYTLI
jgi:hypothetical protein